MIYLLVGLLIAAVYHFVLESIIAPSARLEMRFKLFELRDDLRRLKLAHADGLDDKHFHYLQDSINAQIASLYRYDVAMFVMARLRYERDAEFKKLCDGRARILDDCGVDAVREIRRQSLRVVAAALGVNSAGWLVFIVPGAVVAACLSAIKQQIKRLASLTPRDLDSVIPGLPEAIA